MVIGRGKPFLDVVTSSRGNSRSVCPRGRLLAHVKAGGIVAVLSLTLEGRQSVISSSSDSFTRSATLSQTLIARSTISHRYLVLGYLRRIQYPCKEAPPYIRVHVHQSTTLYNVNRSQIIGHNHMHCMIIVKHISARL